MLLTTLIMLLFDLSGVLGFVKFGKNMQKCAKKKQTVQKCEQLCKKLRPKRIAQLLKEIAWMRPQRPHLYAL